MIVSVKKKRNKKYTGWFSAANRKRIKKVYTGNKGGINDSLMDIDVSVDLIPKKLTIETYDLSQSLLDKIKFKVDIFSKDYSSIFGRAILGELTTATTKLSSLYSGPLFPNYDLGYLFEDEFDLETLNKYNSALINKVKLIIAKCTRIVTHILRPNSIYNFAINKRFEYRKLLQFCLKIIDDEDGFNFSLNFKLRECLTINNIKNDFKIRNKSNHRPSTHFN